MPNLNRWLAKKGVDVTVYTTDIDIPQNIPRNETIDLDGTKVTYFPFSWPRIWEYWRVGFAPAFLPRHWEYSRNLHKALTKKAGDFDLIHITFTFLFASTLGSYYARKNNIPYIISPRGNLMSPFELKSDIKKKLYMKLVERKNLAYTNTVHFTVPKEKEEYINYNLPLENSIVIPNGIGKREFSKGVSDSHFRNKFNISKEKKIILFLSRISWIKGLDTLIPAFARVAKEDPNTVLVIAGGDDEGHKRKVERWIKENNIENKVIFTGMITGEDKTAVFQDSDVFVLPSYSENFGMAVVEAMSFSLPVIITEGVGISPTIRKNNAGLVVKKDENKVAYAILRILQNENFAKDLGERGKKLVNQKYVMSKIADQWVEEYNDIINNHGRI